MTKSQKEDMKEDLELSSRKQQYISICNKEYNRGGNSKQLLEGDFLD